MFEDDESTKKLMASEIERLEGPPRMIRGRLTGNEVIRFASSESERALSWRQWYGVTMTKTKRKPMKGGGKGC